MVYMIRFANWARKMGGLANNIQRSGSETGPVEELIIEKISLSLAPSRLTVKNDSHKHSHHQPMQNAENVKESHFRLEIVSDSFSGKTLPARHRLVYALLEDEFNSKGLHALQMTTRTIQEDEIKQLKQHRK